MKPKVYIKTTIPSYLTAWPSRDLVRAAHQQITQEWWQSRDRFELFVSQVVLRETSDGDQEAVARRVQAIEHFPVLRLTDEAITFARTLIKEGALPDKAVLDALHIAIAVTTGMDYLPTWNCTHIANATMRNKIDAVCRSRGYEPPVICTPEELMEGE